VTVLNNIFYRNVAEYGISVACTNSGMASVTYCDAYTDLGGTHYYGLTPGANCINVDPEFCGTTNHPYWLASDSELRTEEENHGQNPEQNSLVPSEDIDGAERPDADDLTDMGCYENDDHPACN